MIIFITLAVSMITGKLAGALTALIAFPLLRVVSGGYHLKAGMLCMIASTSLMTTLSFIDVPSRFVIALNILALLLVIVYAPSRIEKQSRIPKAFYPKLRLISCFIVLLNFIVGSSVIAATFFVQGLTLVRSLKGGEKHEESIRNYEA